MRIVVYVYVVEIILKFIALKINVSKIEHDGLTLINHMHIRVSWKETNFFVAQISPSCMPILSFSVQIQANDECGYQLSNFQV